MTDPDDRLPAEGHSGATPAAAESFGSVLDDDPVLPPELVGHALDDEPDDGAAADGGVAGIWQAVVPDEAVAFLERPPVEPEVPHFEEIGATDGTSDPPVVVVDSALFGQSAPVEAEAVPIGDFAPSHDVIVLPNVEPDATGPAPAAAEGTEVAASGWITVEPQGPFEPLPVSAEQSPVPSEVPPFGEFAPSYDVTVLPHREPAANGPAAGEVEGGAAAASGWITVEPQGPFELPPVSAEPPPVDAPQVLPWGDGTAAEWMVVDPDATAASAPFDGPIVEVAPDPTSPASDVDAGDLVLHRPGDPLVSTEASASAAYASPSDPAAGGAGAVESASTGEGEPATKRARLRRPRRDSTLKSLLPAIIAGPITIVLMSFLLPLFGLPLPWSSKPGVEPRRNVPVQPAPAPRKKKPKKKTDQTRGSRPGGDAAQCVVRVRCEEPERRFAGRAPA